MPIEITTEGVQKLSALPNAASVENQIDVNAAESAVMRQELPSVIQPDSSSSGTEDGDASSESLVSKVETLNYQLQNLQRDLQFSVDEESGKTIIRVIDRATREIIRIIPPEDITALTQSLERHSGVLFSTSV